MKTLLAQDSPVANTTASASVTAPAANNPQRLFVIGMIFSASAAPAATVVASLKVNGSIVLGIQIPAAAFAPIVVPLATAGMKDGYEVPAGQIALAELPALGGTTLGKATLIYGYK